MKMLKNVSTEMVLYVLAYNMNGRGAPHMTGTRSNGAFDPNRRRRGGLLDSGTISETYSANVQQHLKLGDPGPPVGEKF